MKIRLLLSTAMMASLLALTPHAHAEDSDCGNSGGDFLGNILNKAGCLEDNIDKHVDKIQRTRERINDIKDRAKHFPEEEKARMHDRMERIEGRSDDGDDDRYEDDHRSRRYDRYDRDDRSGRYDRDDNDDRD